MTTQALTAPATATPTLQTYSPPEDKQQLAEVFDFLRAAKAAGHDLQEPQYFLSGATPDQQIPLPREVYLALEQVVDAMRRGMAVAVVPAGKTVTTQEAADLLGVSRPTVVKLIGKGSAAPRDGGYPPPCPARGAARVQAARRDAQYAALAELASDEDPEPEEMIERARRARTKVAQRR